MAIHEAQTVISKVPILIAFKKIHVILYEFQQFKSTTMCIFLKFDHRIYENDTSPFEKGGSRGIFQVDSLLNPPWPLFSKGGNL
jgi:hypothetical protein